VQITNQAAVFYQVALTKTAIVSSLNNSKKASPNEVQSNHPIETGED